MGIEGSALGYADLLRLAVSNGLQELDCTLIQLPAEQNGNHAVVLAAVRTTRGLFRAVGEASRDQLPLAHRDMTLTIAELRAKTRALCEAVGMPQALPSEEGETEAAPPAKPPRQIGQSRPVTEPSAAVDLALPVEAAPPASDVAPAATAADATPARADELIRQPEHVRSMDVLNAAHAGLTDASQAPMPSDTASPEPKAQVRPVAKPSVAPPVTEGLGPDILARLLHMTRKKAESEGAPINEDEAMRRLDSFFQRAFGHPISEGTRMEGQRVIQRLASDLARLAGNSVQSRASGG